MSEAVNLIFDLDGTLIDSSEGILDAVKRILIDSGVTPVCPLTADLIGPPLAQMLKVVTGLQDTSLISRLAAQFMGAYDDEGYRKTTQFSGVERMLETLSQQGYRLYIATNKRENPTLKILELFGWRSYFEKVYALDQFIDCSSKGELLEWIVETHAMDVEHTLYIGDRIADHKAAQQAQLGYLMAQWGYEEGEIGLVHYLSTPDQLLELSKEVSQLLSIADR